MNDIWIERAAQLLLGGLLVALITGPSMAEQNSTHSSAIDHLVYGCATLEQGMDEIEQLLGVRPVRGGRHPQYGTHNALLSLGPTAYLEVIARDPELPKPDRGALVDIPPDGASRLTTWVLRVEDINAAAASARNAGVALGQVESGMRETPDGSVLRWQLTDPIAMPMQGAVPFLINWGDTPHPAGAVPPGGELVNVRIEHPDAAGVRQALSAIGASVAVIDGDQFRIVATIKTKDGEVTLQ